MFVPNSDPKLVSRRPFYRKALLCAAIATVQCNTPGTVLVMVTMRGDDGDHSTFQSLFFSSDGMCPPPPPAGDDAGVTEAGATEAGEDDASSSTSDAGDVSEAGAMP